MASALWAALPDWAIAAPFFLAWASPSIGQGAALVQNAPALMALEFIILHSSVFSAGVILSGGPSWEKTKKLISISLLYGIMALGIALGGKSWQLFGIFLAVVASRAVKLFMQLSESDKARLMGRSIVSALLYLVLAFVSIMPVIPRWGIPRGGTGGSGIWEQEPHRAVFMATAYFFFLGFWEYMAAMDPEKWVPRSTAAQADK